MDNRNILVDGKTFMSFWRGFETCVQPKFLFQHELRSVEEEDVDSSRDIEEQLSIGRRIGFATQISEKLKIPWPLEVKDDILFRSCNLGSEKNRQAYFNQLKAMDGFFDGDTVGLQDNYHFFETLRGRGMSNLESLQVMIKYCFVEGKIEKAEEILEDMMAFGYLDMFSYEIIVAGYLKNNFLDKALYYCGEMRNRHLRLSFALSKSLISSCLKHSRFDEAVKLIMSANKNSKCLGEDLHEIVKIAFEIKNSENQQIILKELKHNPLFLSSTKE
eukprot:Pgem_evm1s7131